MGKNTNQKHNTRTVQALSGKSGKLAAGHIRKRVTESRWIDRESPQSSTVLRRAILDFMGESVPML